VSRTAITLFPRGVSPDLSVEPLRGTVGLDTTDDKRRVERPDRSPTFVRPFTPGPRNDGGHHDGTLRLTYGPATDATYPAAFEVTGVGGTFSDTNDGLHIVGAPVLGLVPVTRDAPDPTNLLAPRDFSRFPVAAGNPNGSQSYDNPGLVGAGLVALAAAPARRRRSARAA
jgi:MYXO-CTERM domain-containing protein